MGLEIFAKGLERGNGRRRSEGGGQGVPYGGGREGERTSTKFRVNAWEVKMTKGRGSEGASGLVRLN